MINHFYLLSDWRTNKNPIIRKLFQVPIKEWCNVEEVDNKQMDLFKLISSMLEILLNSIISLKLEILKHVHQMYLNSTMRWNLEAIEMKLNFWLKLPGNILHTRILTLRNNSRARNKSWIRLLVISSKSSMIHYMRKIVTC